MVYTTSGQIAAVVPYALTGISAATAQLEYNLIKSDPVQVLVETSLPGIFSQNGSGTGAGAILNGDGSLNSASNPAPTGSTIILFGTGEGQTSPPGTDGLLANSVLPAPIAPFSVTIGGIVAHVAYAGAVPTEVAGVLQVNAVVPDGIPPGSAVPVGVKIGGYTSQGQLYVSIGR
jgi:uncharacterized protein (TIGR03437 family)